MAKIIENSTLKSFETKQSDLLSIKGTGNNPRLSPPDMCFSKRQSECFYLLAKGSTTKKIGKILALSPRTIEMYINQLKEKMGLLYKSELVEHAINLMTKNLVNGERHDMEVG